VYSQYLRRYSLPCLHAGWQVLRREHYPDPARDQDEPQQQEEGCSRTTVEFVGDAVDLPPFGWVDGLDRHHVNWFGSGLDELYARTTAPDEETFMAHALSLQLWRDAGFALWDQQRVESLKALDRLRALQRGWIVANSDGG
jgi:hypothetical protein